MMDVMSYVTSLVAISDLIHVIPGRPIPMMANPQLHLDAIGGQIFDTLDARWHKVGQGRVAKW